MSRLKRWLLLLTMALSLCRAGAAESLDGALQKGLLEEEANHNLDAAIHAYQSAVASFDQDRRLGATAVFRLAECYRKQGKTNEAQIQYQRILREFPDQTNLVTLSRIQLPASATAPVTSVQATTAQSDIPEEEQKEIERLKALLRDSPDLINAQSEIFRRGPLHQAAAKGQLYVARFLLENKADINLKAADGGTPLHLAVINGRKTMVELLLERGADVNARQGFDHFGDFTALSTTPLHLAVKRGYSSVVDVLLAHGADVKAKEQYGATALHYAVLNGDLPMARLLLSRGAEVNAQAGLLSASINQNAKLSPLHLACKGRLEMVQLLLASGADVNQRDESETTPLGKALQNKDTTVATAIAIALLKQGADPNAMDDAGRTLLYYTVADGRMELSELLLANKADINQHNARKDSPSDESSATPLSAAVKTENIVIAKFLLGHGADANAKVENDDSFLAMAVSAENDEMVELLLKYKADANAVAAEKSTPLFRAIMTGKLSLVERLLQAGASPNNACDVYIRMQQRMGMGVTVEFSGTGSSLVLTPLQYAVLQKDMALAKLLCKYHADVQVVNQQNGYGLLHLAVCLQDKPMVEFLLTQGAVVDLVGKDGDTPLLWAQTGGGIILFPLPSSNNPMTFMGNRKKNLVTINLAGSWPSINKDDPQMREIVQILIQHGADQYMQRRKEIALTRHLSREVIFRHDPEGRNYFSLLEVISQKLITDMILHFGHLTFPDLAHVTINRLGKGNATPQIIPVDVAGLLHNTNAPLDIMLEWGDEVDVPETDHGVGEPWKGLDADLIQAIQQRVQRKVKLVIKGEANEITLSYRLRAANKANATGPMPGSPAMPLSVPPRPETLQMTVPEALSTIPYTLPAQLETFWMSEVVKRSRRLRTSSDTHHIKIHRIDQTTHHELEMIYDLEPSLNKASFFYDLWLRDGDVIEIPDRE